MSKSELIQRIVEGHPNEIARKDVKGVIEAVAEIRRGYSSLEARSRSIAVMLSVLPIISKCAPFDTED
jgi:hypothetical protein